MATLLTSCPYDAFTLDQLTDNELLQKQVKNQYQGLFGLLMLLFMVGMAFILESYLVAATTWAMIPVLNDYQKKRRAINSQCQKRNL